MSQMTPALELLAVKALHLAFRRFNQGEQRPFILYTYNMEGSETQQLEIDDRDDRETESLVESARQVIARTLDQAGRYAIAYDGTITISGNTRDAAFVEAGERGTPEAFVLAQPYRRRKKRVLPQKKKRPPFVRFGPQLIVARVALLLG